MLMIESKKIKRYRGVVLLAVFVIGALFISPLTAHAGGNPLSTTAAIGIDELSGAVETAIQGMARALNWLIHEGNNFLYMDGVEASWKLVRNFVNMFFIAILVVIAFATIFDRAKYTAKDLLPKLIIAAVLINFSLPITRVTVEVISFPAEIFIRAIGDNLDTRSGQSTQVHLADYQGYVYLIGCIAHPEICATQFGVSLFDGSGDNVIGTSLIQLAITVIVLVAYVLLTVFMFIRIPIILMLVIISPFAWFGAILPSTRQWNEQWWVNVTRWSLFPVVLLFFMYFGILTTNQLSKSFATLYGSDKSITEAQGGFPISLKVMLIQSVGLVFMYAGFIAANKVGQTAGVVGFGAVQKSWGKVKSGAKGVTTKYGPVGGRVAALKKGAGDRYKQFKEEGFKGRRFNRLYGGAQAQRRREEQYASAFGVRKAREQTELIKQVEQRRGSLQQEIEAKSEALVQQKQATDIRQARRMVMIQLGKKYSKRGDPTSIAAQQLLLESGLARSPSDIRNAIRVSGGVDTPMGKMVADSVDTTHLSQKALEDIVDADAQAGNADFATAYGLRLKAGRELAGRNQFIGMERMRILRDLGTTQGREGADKINMSLANNAKKGIRNTQDLEQAIQLLGGPHDKAGKDLLENFNDHSWDLTQRKAFLNQTTGIIGRAYKKKAKIGRELIREGAVRDTAQWKQIVDYSQQISQEELEKTQDEIVNYFDNPRNMAHISPDHVKNAVDLAGPQKARNIIKNVAGKRPDIIADYRKYNDPDPNVRRKPRADLLLESLGEAKDIGRLPYDVWDQKDFRDALEAKYKLLETQNKAAADKFKNAVLNSIIQSKGSRQEVQRKLAVISRRFATEKSPTPPPQAQAEKAEKSEENVLDVMREAQEDDALERLNKSQNR